VVDVGSTEDQREKQLLKMTADVAGKWKLFQALFIFAPDVGDTGTGDMTIFYKRYCKSVTEILDPEGGIRPEFYSVGQHCDN